ncbi:MAG: alpha/beta hydrolase [Actinomycetota bacterium]|nr:alpha/beta hydrolase [Actinomycetota bacterium]
MSQPTRTTNGIAYDRAGPSGQVPVVLLHAGLADRRMWEGVWRGLAAAHDMLRLDLRGFGDSSARPAGRLSPVDDVTECLAELDIGRCHLVGASYGAGVAVEVALTQPAFVSSLILVAPGGSLVAEATPDMRAFIDAERAALAEHDLDAAVEANLVAWVDGPHRDRSSVDATVRALVGQMQRRVFELQADWDDLEEDELDPPALERLSEIRVSTLILEGALDMKAIRNTTRTLTDAVAGATLVSWPDCAHLPSMERPHDFVALLLDHCSSAS